MTTNRIAARAGVNVALVYRYFAGKEAIVGALIERAAQATYAGSRAALEAHGNAPLPVVVRALLQVLVHTPGAPELHRQLFEHMDITRQREQVREQSSRIAELFAACLAQRGGELRALRDPAATLFVLEHAIGAATHAAAFYRPQELALDSVMEALHELVCRSLLPVCDASQAASGRPLPLT
jgi:AcrR family transcriptional regulator